jgi:hypothetical protein
MRWDDWTSRAAELAWVEAPLRARRLSLPLAQVLADGHHLAAWPGRAGALPPLALLLGLLTGWRHWGFDHVFSESLALLALLVLLSSVGGGPAALFALGFACGDFFLSDLPWSPFLRVRLPALIEYLLLALPAVIPVTAKTLLAQLPPPASLSRRARFGLAALGQVGLTAGLVYLWAQAVPILIRPVFTWVGSAPTVAAMEPLQRRLGWVVAAAVLGAAVRMAVQSSTAFHPHAAARLDRLEDRFRSAPPVQPAAERIPAPLQVAGRTALTLLLLAGMLQYWVDAVLLAALVALLHAARMRLVPVPLGRWPAVAERIPLLLRFALALVIVYLASRSVLAQEASRETATFRPIVLLVGFAMLVTFLLAPGPPRPGNRSHGEPRSGP